MSGSATLFASAAAAGLFAGLPGTGWLVLHGLGRRGGVTPWPVAAVIGGALWSIPLLMASEGGAYGATQFGVAGWLVAAGTAVPWARTAWPRRGRLDLRMVLLVAGLGLVTFLHVRFPFETIPGGRDQAVYANTAVFLAREGHVDIPYPWREEAEFLGPMARLPGLYPTPETLTPQFAHLYAAWLAQAHAAFGHRGLFGLNAVLSLLSVAVFFCVARLLVPLGVAVGATLFLALNPSQVYLARITLSEVMCQAFVWCSVYLLVSANRSGDAGRARWAGLVLTAAVLTRIDTLVLLPLLMVGHVVHQCVAAPDTRRRLEHVRPAFLQVALPGFAVAFWVYQTFSTRYFGDLRDHVWIIMKLVFWAATLSLVVTPAWQRRLGSVLRRPVAAVTVIALAGIALGYAYWLRPVLAPVEVHAVAGDDVAAKEAAPVALERRWSLVNLGRYVSPPVLVLAFVGFGVLVWRARRGGTWAGVLFMLAVVIAAFLYDPVVSPDHFWAIRRFVPVVIPAVVLFAAVGGFAVARRLPRPGQVTVTGAAAVGLGAFVIVAAGPILFAGENVGGYEDLAAFAAALPEDELILAPITRRWHKHVHLPLALSFDRRIYPMRLHRIDAARIAAWLSRPGGDGTAYVLSTDITAPVPGHSLVEVATLVWTLERFERPLRRLPRSRTETVRTLTLFRLQPTAAVP